MHPQLLFADSATARNRDLLVEANQHRRTGFVVPGQSVEATIRAAARRVAQRRTPRAIPESAAA